MNIDNAKRILKLVPEANRAVRAFKKQVAAGEAAVFGRDVRGFEIRVGCKVAFNRSGYLAHGEVVSIPKAFVAGEMKGGAWTRTIMGECRIRASDTQKISKVRDPESIMVIFE